MIDLILQALNCHIKSQEVKTLLKKIESTLTVTERNDNVVYAFSDLGLTLLFNQADLLIKAEIAKGTNPSSLLIHFMQTWDLCSLSQKALLPVFGEPTKVIHQGLSQILLYDKKTHWFSFIYKENELTAIHLLSIQIIPKSYSDKTIVQRLCTRSK